MTLPVTAMTQDLDAHFVSPNTTTTSGEMSLAAPLQSQSSSVTHIESVSVDDAQGCQIHDCNLASGKASPTPSTLFSLIGNRRRIDPRRNLNTSTSINCCSSVGFKKLTSQTTGDHTTRRVNFRFRVLDASTLSAIQAGQLRLDVMVYHFKSDSFFGPLPLLAGRRRSAKLVAKLACFDRERRRQPSGLFRVEIRDRTTATMVHQELVEVDVGGADPQPLRDLI